MPSAAPPAQSFPKIGPADKRQYARFQAFLPARCPGRGGVARAWSQGSRVLQRPIRRGPGGTRGEIHANNVH